MYGWTPEMTERLLAAAGAVSPVDRKDAVEKAAQEEADAKKTPDEKLLDARRNCEIAGQRFSGRILGMLDRETGKLIDQYSILEKHREEVPQIVTKNFLDELDKVMVERGFREPPEEKESEEENG
jgi:hypothetical protein